MSLFKRLQALIRGSSGASHRVRTEPRLPEQLYAIPERGMARRPAPTPTTR